MDNAGAEDIHTLDIGPDELKRRLIQLFRYGQIGHCVSSVAHDINNHLGAMLAYAELVSLDEALSPDTHQMLGEMVSAVKKCSTLVSAFTAIARKDKPTASMVDPLRLVQQVIQIRSYSIKACQATLETDFPESVSSIIGDPPKLMQALIALVMNAEEAVTGTADGIVRVSVRQVDSIIEIAVWNSGEPVPERVRARAFEPFYTSKSGEHFGIGLAFAKAIVEGHNGTLAYEPDEGFVMRLPKETGISWRD
jgi:two-component system NtrC family sensor kinase